MAHEFSWNVLCSRLSFPRTRESVFFIPLIPALADSAGMTDECESLPKKNLVMDSV
jgi:hypothetical protein